MERAEIDCVVIGAGVIVYSLFAEEGGALRAGSQWPLCTLIYFGRL
jgi:hypothetical protein